MLEHEEKYAVILAFDVKVRGRNLIYGQARMRASTMLEHEEKYAVILTFDVKVRGGAI